MTDNPQPAPEKSEVEKLRDEFAAQFAEMKTAFESQISELKKSNDDLTSHNKELERALIRSASSDPPAPPQPAPSPEEEYAAIVKQRTERALELQKFM